MGVRFRKSVSQEDGLRQIDIVPFINLVFLLLILLVLTSSITSISGIIVKLPRVFTQEALNAQTLTIVITSEDVFYIENRPFTLKDIGNFIKEKKYNYIFIKADNDASLGALAGIWNLCKQLGIEKIGIATTYK